MDLLLLLAGAGLAFAAGWWLARSSSREPLTITTAETPPAPEPTSPDRYELVAQHHVGVVVSDRRGQVVWRNEAARALAGTHVGVLVDESIERHVDESLENGSSSDVLEMYGPPKVVLDVDAHRLPSGGVVVFIDDISERRRIDQVRTDFVANISHELKTPVGALSVLAETLEDETDPETMQRVVGRMQGEAARASRTIDDLLELSRIELGGERDIEPIRLPDVVNEAMGRVAELAEQRQVGVSNLMAADQYEDIVVHGDRRQLISALGNLVENGVKYSEQGGLVQIRARYHEGIVELGVTDEGIGIPKRDLDRIFERFYRVDKARSRETGGTGLGLSIVRHVAQNHGGDVAVRSVEGEGSTFMLRLPARRAGERAVQDPTHGTDSDSSAEPDQGGDAQQGIA